MLKRICQHRSLWVISAIITGAIIFIECTNMQTSSAAMPRSHAQYSEYAGSRACAACHKEIYDTHIHTAHFHTSEQANESNVKGSFEKGKNTFQFNEREYVAMERRNGRLYQVDYFKGKENMAQPIDITTGSGKRGQTYLYWEENKLFQLPISYFTSLDQWTNSPGYANRVVFNRPITTRCLECHSTYFQKSPDDQAGNDEFSRTNIIYGVDCEKCHGPGVRHIAFHKNNPDDKQPHFIINTNKLTRQQNLDLCRLCHGGKLVKLRPSFTFQVGDSLSGFFYVPPDYPDPNGIDVHGNQYGLLASSKCFRGSQMTCVTCHNSHRNEEGMVAEFSAKCMNCHNTEQNNFCKLKHKEKYNITANCIDCHMPELNSKAITVLLQGESTPAPASMRTHFITVYPEETKKYLARKHQ